MASSGIVESFMEVTSCGSESVAVTHLSSCSWRLEDAVNLYFTAGPVAAADPPPRDPNPIPARAETAIYDDDGNPVRAPIPARSETLYNHAAASSSSSYAAPSVWAAERKPPPPSPTPVQPVDVEMQDAYLPETKATGWASDGDNGIKESEIASKEEQVEHAEEGKDEDDDMEASEEDGYRGEYEYGTEAEEAYIDDDEQDDDAYLQGAESGHQSPPRQPRADKNLDDLFRPPHEIMFQGSFHEAKIQAASSDRWLLVNVQSVDVFTSHLHNRDLWSNEVVVQVIQDNFVFSLMEKQDKEGGKVCCFYKLDDDRLPAVLVLDPITGQLLAKWCGLVQEPSDFLTSIGKYTESKPSMLSRPKKIVKRVATPEPPVVQEPAMPENPASGAQDLPAMVPKIEMPAAMVEDEQPVQGETVYKLMVRFPNGNTVTKEFGSKQRVAALFAYCRSVVHDQKGTEQAFRIMRLAAGRAFEQLRDEDASFEDLKLNRDTVTVVLDT